MHSLITSISTFQYACEPLALIAELKKKKKKKKKKKSVLGNEMLQQTTEHLVLGPHF